MALGSTLPASSGRNRSCTGAPSRLMASGCAYAPYGTLRHFGARGNLTPLRGIMSDRFEPKPGTRKVIQQEVERAPSI